MSYLVFARKYRPGDFTSVKGQDHVTRTLVHAIERGRIAHAFLFTGPRGVGKTSVSRILAKALNCESGPTATPCGTCPNCLEVAKGTSLAVREIDGASHNGVDHVRDLIDSVRALPPPGYRYKVFIIDEVHMLSLPAFNALLKCLEEPPPHTVFILATTEVHKIPETVISRCQRHDFRALALQEVMQQLQGIAANEGFDVHEGALRMIARLSEGSMRDAQSLLDRVHAYCAGAITQQETGEILGVVNREALDGLARAILTRNCEQLLSLLDEVFARGIDPALFARDFAAFWHELLLVKFNGSKSGESLGLSKAELESLLPLVSGVSERDLQDLAEIARDGCERSLRSLQPRFAIEALGIRMATREPVQNIAVLLASLMEGKPGGTAGKPGGKGEAGGGESSQAGGPLGSAQKGLSPARGVESVSGTDGKIQPAPRPSEFPPQASPKAVAYKDTSVSSSAFEKSSVLEKSVPSKSVTVPEPIAADRPQEKKIDAAHDNSVPAAPKFDWHSFIESIDSEAGRLITDCLRRMAPVVEADRKRPRLTLRGNAFSVATLRRPEHFSRVVELLERH